MPELPQQPERALVHDVVALLRKKYRCVAWRNNVGRIPLQSPNGDWRAIHMGEKGLPDVIGVLPGGRCIAVECKRPGNRLSQWQIHMLDELRARNALVIVAYDIRDVEVALAAPDPAA